MAWRTRPAVGSCQATPQPNPAMPRRSSSAARGKTSESAKVVPGALPCIASISHMLAPSVGLMLEHLEGSQRFAEIDEIRRTQSGCKVEAGCGRIVEVIALRHVKERMERSAFICHLIEGGWRADQRLLVFEQGLIEQQIGRAHV